VLSVAIREPFLPSQVLLYSEPCCSEGRTLSRAIDMRTHSSKCLLFLLVS